MFRLLQTVLFKTYSVFDALFACFDETIDFYQWIKPWKSYITVAKMQKQNINWFSTLLRVVICFIILTDLTEFSLKFCVDEVFDDREGLDVRRRKRGKSSSLGMPKAPQVNIQEDSSVSAWGCPGRHLLFLLTIIGNFTWSYIFIRHMICVLLGASCMI